MLYKDPSGERVFADDDVEVRKGTKFSGRLLGYEKKTDALQIKIKSLETMISEYQVVGVQNTHPFLAIITILFLENTRSGLHYSLP